MKKLFTLVTIILAMVVSSCTYDDTAVWNKLEDHESRISTLEELCREMNTNISALQSLVDAMQGGDYITSIVPVTKDGNIIGYTITFAKAQSITIYHGKDGQNGADGKDSDFVPTIGVKQDTDGIYYWTLDGEWLLDDNGNKIKAVSTDGKDGITPQLKIEEGYWYVSYDNGTSWTQLGKAMGEDSQDGANGADGKDGDSFFQSVTQDEQFVYFTLADGTVITLPKGAALDITFAESDLVVMSPNSTREIGYTVTSVTESVKVEVTSSADIKAKVVADDESGLTGKIHIITGDAIDEYSKVIVFVSNGDKVIMRSITFEEAGLMVEENATLYAAAEGGEVALNFLTNVECEVVIPEEAQSWISVVPATRAMEKQTITLKLEPNEGYYRSATVTVQSSDGTLKLEYQVEQEGELGVEIGPTQIPDNQIWYTSTDGTIVEPKDGTVSGGTLVSNTYVDGVGILTFSSDVTALNQDAFNNRDTLKSIILPNSLISIGNSAFRDCTSLTSVTIPDSVTSIGNYAFDDCDSLTSVYITDIAAWCNISFSYSSSNPLSYAGNLYLNNELVTDLIIPDSVTSIGDDAFYNCDSLTSVTIPDSVTSIGKWAFDDCDSLTNVTIPDSVTTIGDYAFYDCDSLTSVTIGNGVTSIGDSAFRYCDSLTSVTIGNGVTSIGKEAFRFCSSLTSVTIPDSVTSIGNYVFDDCDSLTSVTIGNSVTSIGDYAFQYCTSLTSVTIPDSVTSIGDYTFFSCTSLTSVTIPDSVTSIGSSAFCVCTSLTSVTIPDSVTSIEKWAFQNCTSLTSVTIGNGVTSIGSSAFGNCTSLTSVTIPDSVTSIGESAFNGCSGELIINSKIIETDYNATNYPANSSSGWLYESRFTKLTIGDNITEIGNFAFYSCDSLTSVTIPDSVTKIGDYAFRYCDSLTSVTIPDSVTTIGDFAFYSCSSLTSVTIGNGVTSIGKEAFSYCSSLTSVTIGSSVTSIGRWAFSYCDSLTSVTMPDSVTSIGDYTFFSCTSLTSVTIPDSVTSIGSSAFCVCSSLTSVTIPDSVTSIGKWAFQNCTSLKEVYCKPTTPPTGGSSMFDDNASGRKIYVPSNSVSAYKSAAYWSDYADYIVGYNF